MKELSRIFIKIVLLFFLSELDAAERFTNENLLSRLLRLSGKRPVVLVLQKKDGFRINVGQHLDYDYIMGFNDRKADGANNDFDMSNLNELKSKGVFNSDSLEELQLNPKAVSNPDSLEDTHHILRSALRTRCHQVYECVRKCPTKRPTCPLNCQQVFDNLNLCEPPTTPDPCRKPRCGKTMPPKWRLL